MAYMNMFLLYVFSGIKEEILVKDLINRMHYIVVATSSLVLIHSKVSISATVLFVKVI